METWDAIRARRDVRAFDSRPIAGDDLDRILEAGRRAPSALNRQPWDFVAVTEPERLRALSEASKGAGHVASSAATIAILGLVPEDDRQVRLVNFDLGQAVLSMMLAAADLGIGSGHSSVNDQTLPRRLLGYPEDRFCAHLLPLGYPADRPLVPLKRPDRRAFDDVVHRERW